MTHQETHAAGPVAIIWAGIAWTGTDLVENGRPAVAVRNGRILAVGPLDELAAAYPQADREGDAQAMLLPGLINSHDHGRGLGTLRLGVPDDLLEIWLPGLGGQPALDPALVAQYEATLLLTAGVTGTAHSHNPQQWTTMEVESHATLQGYADAGLRVAFHPPLVDQNGLIYADREAFLHGLPATLQPTAKAMMGPIPLAQDEYLDLCQRLYTTYHDAANHRAHIQISPAGGQWCSDELITAAAGFARRNRTRLQMHMLETRYQRAYARRTWQSTFMRHLDRLGVVEPQLTLAHMVWVDREDLHLVAERGAGVAHNPSSNLRLRSGIAPVPAMLAAGIPTGIGLDGHGLDDDQDFLRELRLAWTLANRPGAGAPSVPAATILRMATADGAAVTFGSESGLGHLAPGAPADLMLVDLASVAEVWAMPGVSPLELLLRRGARQHVRHVMVHGEWMVRDGRPTRVNPDELRRTLREQLQAADSQALANAAAGGRALAPYIRRFYQAWDAAREDDCPGWSR